MVGFNVFNMQEREEMIKIKEKNKKLVVYVVILFFELLDTNFES